MLAAFDRFIALVRKAGFNPDQPRQPGPGDGAGQWIYVEGYAQGRQSDPAVILAASPGIGHNTGPSLDERPDIPKQDPGDPKSRLQQAKDAAKWLALFGARRIPVVAGVLIAVEAAQWLRSEWPSIRSYRDEPKTYDELVRGAKETRPGYHQHHVVEQTAVEKDGFPRSMIDGVDNVVSVPIYKHREISGWYQQRNPLFGGLSPREYLRGKGLVGAHAGWGIRLAKIRGAEAMTAKRYQELTTPELVTEFENLCLAQYQADQREETGLYNRLFKRTELLQAELKSRSGDQRRALQVFFGRGNLQVRLMAAHANLTIDYQKSRRELQAIEATRWMPQAANAGMALEFLDTGFYRPT